MQLLNQLNFIYFPSSQAQNNFLELERNINIIPHFKAQGSARKKIEVREGVKDKLEYQITKFQLPSRFCPFLNYFATMCVVGIHKA